MTPDGIFPIIFFRIMLNYNAGLKNKNKLDFFTFRPLISIIEILAFYFSASASSLSPISSDKSLFFEIFKFSIP